MAYTATRPRGSATWARDCISHIALPFMLYLLHTKWPNSLNSKRVELFLSHTDQFFFSS